MLGRPMMEPGRPGTAPAQRSGGISEAFPIDRIDAVIFDMDGVVTDTAAVHFQAWKLVFDAFLAERATARPDPSSRVTAPHRPFDADDYRRHVDGKPRESGVRDFLAARGIVLPEGRHDDAPGRDTIVGIGLRKNGVFLDLVASQGVEAFPTTIEFARRLQALGRRIAIISASENATAILDAAGLLRTFEVQVDGTDSRRLDLAGKPHPAIFLEAARRLGVQPERTAVVEDALAGVQAGVQGGFAFVLAVDRTGFARELAAAGASLVVSDLGELLVPSGR